MVNISMTDESVETLQQCDQLDEALEKVSMLWALIDEIDGLPATPESRDRFERVRHRVLRLMESAGIANLILSDPEMEFEDRKPPKCCNRT